MVDGVGIDTCETALLELLLQRLDAGHVELSIEQEHGVALVLCSLDVAVLLVLVGGIEVDEIAVLVLLACLDERLVFVEGKVFALRVLHQRELLGAVIEILLRQDAVVDEELQVVPFLLVGLAILVEDGLQAVAHLLCDVGGDLLHLAVALQIAARDVQRNIGRVDDAVQQREELRHDALHLVGHKHLVAVELNLVLLQFERVLDAGEVEDTRQIEGIVDVEVNPEQRLVLHGIECAIERLVVLVLQRRRGLRPQRLHIIYNVVLGGVHHLLLVARPLLLLAEGDGHGQELAVFLQQALNLLLVEELLAVVVDVEDDVSPPFQRRACCDGFVIRRIVNLEGRAAVAAPLHSLGAFLVALGDDFHLLRHHERAVEAQAEVADDVVGLILVLLQEVVHA